MLGIHDFGLFVCSGILLNLTPGPDTAYILGRSIANGQRAGVASAIGVGIGCIFHTCAAAFGLSALLATSALAFATLKLAGAGYLIFLGVRMLLQRDNHPRISTQFKRNDNLSALRQGMLTNILNPKVALFFLAFLPQFIEPTTSSKVIAFLILGLTFVTTGTLWALLLAWFASVFSRRLRGNTAVATILHRTTGSLLVFLGLRLALVSRR